MERARGGWRISIGAWCALGAIALPLAVRAEADPTPGSVVINEIHYHPVTDNQEFVELFNPGGTTVDLAGACFTAGITGCFPSGTTLPAGGFVVAAQQLAAYQAAFPTAPAPALIYGGSLSNSGEAVTISATPVPPDPALALDSVTYADAAPWPQTPDGDGPSLELADPTGPNSTADAWRAADPAPTPGAVNTQFGKGPGPEIASVTPGPVAADQPLAFTASIAHATSAAVEVTIGFAAPTSVPLVDDGAHGDGAAGDGTFGATIAGQPAGTLVRYRALAANASGTAALPADGSVRPRFGFVVARPAVSSTLPLVDWYVAPSDHQQLLDHPLENDYVPVVVVVGGEVWDGAEVRINGHARNPKKYSYKFKLPKGSPLTASFLTAPVDEFVLDGDMDDPSGVVAPLVSSVYADSNPLIAQMAKVHVEQNGADFGLFTFVEEYDKLWRVRNGLDGSGDEQYEPEDIIGVLVDAGSAGAMAARYEKVAPDDADFTRAYEVVRAVDSAPTPARIAALRDLFDIPALIEFLAVGTIVQHWDTTVHNYELLREGTTGRWRLVAVDYDNDLAWQSSELLPQGPENLVSALRSDPVLTDLYLRRVRTLADRYLASGLLEQRLTTMSAAVAADQAADLVRWPRPSETAAQGKARLAGTIGSRTTALLATGRTPEQVPAAPTPGLPVTIAAARFAGEGGSARDWVRLHNPSATEAIDLSGWRLEGAGAAALPPGTVIPANGDVTVPTVGPASAVDRFPGSFVAGALADGLDDAGTELLLRDASGAPRGAAVLSDLVDAPPATVPALAVEASADQVETLAPGGNGVKLTVAVSNRSLVTIPDVVLTGAGTTCGRSLGDIRGGRTVVVRCTVTGGTAGTARDRSFRFRATSGSRRASSNRVDVRTLDRHTAYWSATLPGAPKVGLVELGDADTIRVPVTLAPLTTPSPASQPPVRWIVASALGVNRGIPTQGAMLAPGPVVSVPLADGVPVRVNVAARNRGGTGARSPMTPFLTPRPTVTWPAASRTELVTRIFEDVDGRAPTPAELAATLAGMDRGESPASVIEDRLETGRWPTQVEPLIRLYQAYLGRPADAKGLEYWMAQRARGRTLNSISSSFAGSAEFVRSTGSLSNAAFVRFVYTSVLRRQPDAAGAAYWTKRLGAGLSRGQVMTSFSESREGRAKLAPGVIPTVVWVALIGRPPTAVEAQPATDWLNAGGSMKTVIEGVRSSDAYGARPR